MTLITIQNNKVAVDPTQFLEQILNEAENHS